MAVSNGSSFGGTGHATRQAGRTRSSSGMSTSLSGRLRSVSDLEKTGLVSEKEKGMLKDLIIRGDEALKSALDKYQTGDSSELEALISRGHLDRSGSIDLTELDSLDLGSLGIDSMEFLGMFEGQGDAVDGGDMDYEFSGSQGMGFEMDDILSLPFPGMDDVGSSQDPSAGGPQAHATRSATSGSSASAHPAAAAQGPGTSPPTILHSHPIFGGAKSSPPSAPAAPKRSAAVTTTTSASGTTTFPNSVPSGTRFPTSNCVAELPALQSLPQVQAPAYEQLINFQRAKSKDAIRCVMCGKAPTEGDGGTVIPQQNKDVCRDCDKALWVHGDTGTYFKWCKGCKRFRNIVAFSEKLDASKCNSCRERGRRSYLQRKGANGQPITTLPSGASMPPAPAVMAPSIHNHSIPELPPPRGLD